MGTIIGRQGLKIKHIQDVSGVRMVAQKEMLPQSTERIVEVQGTPEGIQRAVWEICKCLVDDWQRGTGTVLYNPVVRTQPGGTTAMGAAPTGSGPGYGAQGGRAEYGSSRVTRTGNGADFSNGGPRTYNRRSDSDAANRGPPTHDENGEEIQTQNISIPADMVGCIIGRAGSKISEIRKTSGARISIAKVGPARAPPFPFAARPAADGRLTGAPRRDGRAHVHHHGQLQGERDGPVPPLRKLGSGEDAAKPNAIARITRDARSRFDGSQSRCAHDLGSDFVSDLVTLRLGGISRSDLPQGCFVGRARRYKTDATTKL